MHESSYLETNDGSPISSYGSSYHISSDESTPVSQADSEEEKEDNVVWEEGVIRNETLFSRRKRTATQAALLMGLGLALAVVVHSIIPQEGRSFVAKQVRLPTCHQPDKPALEQSSHNVELPSPSPLFTNEASLDTPARVGAAILPAPSPFATADLTLSSSETDSGVWSFPPLQSLPSWQDWQHFMKVGNTQRREVLQLVSTDDAFASGVREDLVSSDSHTASVESNRLDAWQHGEKRSFWKGSAFSDDGLTRLSSTISFKEVRERLRYREAQKKYDRLHTGIVFPSEPIAQRLDPVVDLLSKPEILLPPHTSSTATKTSSSCQQESINTTPIVEVTLCQVITLVAADLPRRFRGVYHLIGPMIWRHETSSYLYFASAAGGHYILDIDLDLTNGVAGFVEYKSSISTPPSSTQDSVWRIDSALGKWVHARDLSISCEETEPTVVSS